MKYILSFCILALSLCNGFSQKTNPNYDEELATKLGADDYGMKSYIFVILKTGSNTEINTAFRDSCFMGHMSNIGKMVEDGKLVIAGPMGENEDNYRGIFILNVATKEEAELILQTDPAISANFLEPLIFEWYGSAAIPEYLDASDKVWKVGF